MREGDITHEEVNAAIAAADKTIVVGRQNRLRDGVLIDGDEQLPRFQMNHDRVKFLYSAIRQLPEYFLDALLAKDVTVTMVQGRALLCFKDVRNHQAIHSGLTRRTIYLPELLLDVAFRNGYDYWSVACVLIGEGWKLLDFVLLLEMVEEAKRYVLTHSAPVMGYSTFRRFLRQKSKHRSWLESEELKRQRDQFKLDIAVSEMEEFIKLYEKPFLRLMRLGPDYLYEIGREDLLSESPGGQASSFVLMSSDAAAKALSDEYREGIWAERKSREYFEELDFPDYFLLDRDIVHPAARETAAGAGQDTAPKTMDEARHDYRDVLRFGIGPEIGTEKLVEQGIGFGHEGLMGLVREIVDYLFAEGRPNELLREWTWEALVKLSSRSQELEESLERGMALARFGSSLNYLTDVRTGAIEPHEEDVDFLRGLMVQLAQTKGKRSRLTEATRGDNRIQMLLLMNDVGEMADQLKALLVGEASSLLGHHVSAEQLETPAILKESDAQFELAMVRAMLCLDLAPNLGESVAAMAGRGPQVEEILESFVAAAGRDEERQVAVAAAQRALDAERGKLGLKAKATADLHPGLRILGDLHATVTRIQGMLPDRMHGATSGTGTALRKAVQEFENIRRERPADPDQLGALAMVLLRLDRAENQPELLEEVRGMGDYAVGIYAKKGLASYFTPGLMRVVDEADPAGAIGQNALKLAEELTGLRGWETIKARRAISADLLDDVR